MAKVLQHRRDTTANLSSVSGAIGEFFMDTTKNTLVVMDGSTNGGHPLALESDLYTNSDVDAHLNQSNPTSGYVLSWNGSDYAWVAQASGADGNTQYTMQADTTAGGANLTLVGNDASTDSVKLEAGSNITITRSDANTITIASTASGGGGDLSAVAEDILPSFDAVYDLGSTTNQWYDLFVSNSVTIGGGSLSGNEAGLVTDTILVGELLTTLNTITPDASSALQYAGDQGAVEIIGNLDVSAGDWMFTPIVETTLVESISDGNTANIGVRITYRTDDPNYHYLTFYSPDDAEVFLSILNQPNIKSFTIIDPTNSSAIITFTFNGTSLDAGEANLGVDWGIGWLKSSGEFTTNVPSDYEELWFDPLAASITSTVVNTIDVPPLTTGYEGMMRYNKDSSRFEGYNVEGWASLGGLETNEAGQNVVTGDLLVTGDVISNSDASLKDNIEEIKGALDIVTNLSGKFFTMKSDESQKQKVGFIAQEIEEHLPQVVSTDPDGIKSVAYGNIAALLVEAIKELNTKIDNLNK